MKQSTKIQHLYQRAGFGLTPQEWTKRKDWSIKKITKELFSNAAKVTPLPFLHPLSTPYPLVMGKVTAEELERRKRQKQEVREVNIEWLKRMTSSIENALEERMCLFWHGHFACKTNNSYLITKQLNNIRQHALGNFRDLVLAIARDPSMIRYLNNQQNRKAHPNENFARELLELFTIGIGHYSEQDIQEAARAFTGWSSTGKTGQYVFRQRQHDFDEKTFFGKTGYFDGEAIIDLILEKKETAYFITRKIYQYFVNRQVDEQRVKALASSFYQSNYDIGQLMQTIFESNWFYDPKNVGTKIKSPIDLMTGLIRQLNIAQIKPLRPLLLQKKLGQVLFAPPNVAGWAGGKNWIDNSTLTMRIDLAERIWNRSNASKRKPKKSKNRPSPKANIVLDLQPLLKMVDGLGDTETFDLLKDYLIQTPTPLTKDKLHPFLLKGTKEEYVTSTYFRLMSLPEYQLC